MHHNHNGASIEHCPQRVTSSPRCAFIHNRKPLTIPIFRHVAFPDSVLPMTWTDTDTHITK